MLRKSFTRALSVSKFNAQREKRVRRGSQIRLWERVFWNENQKPSLTELYLIKNSANGLTNPYKNW
jgi:hypothetical protein